MSLTKYPHRPAWYDAPYEELRKFEGLVSCNIQIGEKRTSVRLDAPVLEAIKEIAGREGITPNELYTKVSRAMPKGLNFTVALRSFVLRYFREAATAKGHRLAGHGFKG